MHVETARFAEKNNERPPRHLGQRYDANTFLPEAGNTIVCALDVEDTAHKAVLRARDQIKALPGADGFLFTPASSLHMTVFEGVIETRRTPDAWPADLDRTLSVTAVTKILAKRLQSFPPPPAFAVRVIGLQPTGLMLAGASAADEANLTAWRSALTDPFGFRHREHDAYSFHMTFAYPLRWLPDDVLSEWDAGLRMILADLVNDAPVLPLQPPAFCQFEDMTFFKEHLRLGG